MQIMIVLTLITDLLGLLSAGDVAKFVKKLTKPGATGKLSSLSQ